ncbi:glycosyltransferase family 2 protein [Allorhodopirellula heiligendammensis]|uniref:Glycosyl transferase family 2 n=1 Tax=Allorhodopirellula heiligendammensis TaxID=2714739 RepID=A0A5C6C256_9BACT|nr:glycosyltransferase [Allorhodopirellula heiligendammensis]TWU18077.1 Glycosyl transferase family 2 [Allorhodopirellula heiligendammensis]
MNELGIVAIGRNEGERLKACLASLQENSTDSVIVYVDSGSDDGSVAFARSLGVHVVELDREIPFTAARARNAGVSQLQKLSGSIRWIQFLDGDCQLQPQWMERAIECLETDSKLAAVCGRRRERFPDRSIYNALIDMEWDTPVGEALACGGDALFRLSALHSVGGFTESMIAGEEPELCQRLRCAGWGIRRIDAEMTLHDADLHHFSQWWRRAKRFGHAAAEAFQRYGNRDEPVARAQLRGIVLWGGFIPVFNGLLLLIDWRIGLFSLLIWPIQWARLTVAFARTHPWSFAARRSALQLLCKFAEFGGVVSYWSRRIAGRQSTLIEYKSGPSNENESASAPGTDASA